jgi:hypothetical protein
VSQIRGRPRALGGGYLIVQALAGLSRAGEGPDAFDEARALFEKREGFDFSLFWCCTDDVTLLELARAARVAGRADEADALLEQARQAGSREAISGSGPS